MDKNKKHRRDFLKKASGLTLLTGLNPMSVLGSGKNEVILLDPVPRKRSANDTIQIASIGMGIMGFNDTNTALKVPGVKLMAACDLYDGHLTRVKEDYGKNIFTTKDFREILDRKDIDAVIIATTDHWHDKIAIEAMKSGKAIYCEKPMVHHINEGNAVVEAQQKYGVPFQVGSQRVSSIVYQKAHEMYKEGLIGQLVLAEAWYDRQSALGAWQYSIPRDASKETIDWNAFQGDAPDHAFDPVRFFRWRNYRDYGTGVAGDLFVHLFSGLHVILDSKGPERIYTSGGLRYWNDGRDVPDVLIGCYDYPETTNHPAFNLQMRVNFVDGGGGGSTTRLVGSEGVMTIGYNNVTVTQHLMDKAPGYGGWDTYNAFDKVNQKNYVEWYDSEYPSNKNKRQPKTKEYRAPEGYDEHLDHHQNFFNAVRGEGTIVENATFGFRAAASALASNLSYFENKVVHWDPDKMTLI